MSRVRDGLLWNGVDAMLSLFVLTEVSLDGSMFREARDGIAPREVRFYELEDDTGLLEHHHLFEYDFVFARVPSSLEPVLRKLFRRTESVVRPVVAWFGFEGTFNFEYLLHPDTASHIYAIAYRGTVAVALEDDVLLGKEWMRTVSQIRVSVLADLKG